MNGARSDPIDIPVTCMNVDFVTVQEQSSNR